MRLTRRTNNGVNLICENCQMRGKCSNSLDYFDCSHVLADRLADYEDAEEQGLFIRLPCKVGDTFYYIAGTLRGDEYVASETVVAIEILDAKPWIIDSYGCHHIEFWFTREEAEAALKGVQDDV